MLDHNVKPIERTARPGDTFITLFRAIACLLIINSHCREIYPLYFLAVGGGHGNAIFFAISGYCLARISQPFALWYRRRVKRILPVTLLVLLFGALLDGPGSFTNVGILDILHRFLDRYWFVWAILLYYCLFYQIFVKASKKISLGVLAGYIVGYFAMYMLFVDRSTFSVELEGFSPFKVYFYFGVFVAGGIVRLYKPADQPHRTDRGYVLACLAAIVASGIVWCGEYALVMVFNTGFNFQFLIHMSVFAFAVAIILLGIALDAKLKLPGGKVGALIKKIADSTLEIYLIQVTAQPFLPEMAFPLNWIVFVGLSLCGGIALNAGYSFVTKRIGR